LNNAVVDEERTNFNIQQALFGDTNVSGLEPNSISVVYVSLERNPDYESVQPGTSTRFVKLTLRDRFAKEKPYWFGETAISETMAYLMEQKFFPYQKLSDFPYRACQKLGEHLGSEITKNDEWLFALCDVSLLSRMPGWMFYEIVNDMTRAKYTPEKSTDIYDYALRLMYYLGVRVWEDYKQALDGAITVLRNLFSHPYFKPTIDWFEYILKAGYDVRKAGPHVLFDLYKEAKALEGLWNNFYLKFGTPQLHNSKHERYFNPPYDLYGKGAEIEPLFLLASQQLQKLFLTGKAALPCTFLPICSQNKNGLQVDNRCKAAPWERASDQLTCAYGALWLGYGFNGTDVEFVS
jgi:hypothetical protein